jgi:hypothetical protein
MPDNIQGNWRFCFKCQGMWFGGFAGSVCPDGGSHSQSGSGNYALVHDFGGSERQSGWRFCSKCLGLWFGGNTGSHCPAGGGHVQTGSFDYSLSHNAPNVPEQSDWRWCNKCQGLFWAGAAAAHTPSVCKPIENDIGELEALKDDLQAQLQVASTPEKPQLVAAINNLSAQINVKQAQLTQCVNDHRRPCPAGGSHSGDQSGEYRIPQLPQNVRLHFKVLTAPAVNATSSMLTQMRQVYNAVGIGVDLVSSEALNLPTLTDLDVGLCGFTSGPTSEQNDLFTHRNSVNGDDLVIYFVRSTVPATGGCAVHPAGKPGAVITQFADVWTLAHEVGHVLGLEHADKPGARTPDRLMTGGGVFNKPPLNVVASEVSTMKSSALTVNA